MKQYHHSLTLLCFFLVALLLVGTPYNERLAADALPPSLAARPPISSDILTRTVYLPLVYDNIVAPVVIAAAHIDSAISGEADEALLLWNNGLTRQPLAGWAITTASRRATFPITSTLALEPGAWLWCAAEASTFQLSFGERPSCEWATDSDPDVPNLNGTLAFANQGGQIQLYSAQGLLMDTLLYGNESQPVDGWQGTPAQIYTRGDIPREGQIWARKRNPQTGLPLDTDQAVDWQGDIGDLQWGRQVRFPGWQEKSTEPLWVEQATITVAVAPEGLYAPLAAFIAQSQATLDLSLYTIEHRELAEEIAAAAQRGVLVRLLLEGGPPGGISDLQKWSVATIAAAGGEVQYLAVHQDAPKGYRTRYRYLHAKYGISDGTRIFNGTENLSYDAMPIAQSGPVGGRRGFYLFVDAAAVAAQFSILFAHDWSAGRFADRFPYTPTDDTYGAPPADFVFPEQPLYAITEAPFRAPVVVSGSAAFLVSSTPENATRPDQGILALLAQAEAGDEIVVMQLYEHKQWGDTASHPVADPNPRLEQLIDAARRGAQVRVLLDSYFDDTESLRNNEKTVAYLNAVAIAEGLSLEARTGNPTLGGIHAKLFLLRIGGRSWSAVGSLNGGEVSHKLNREVVLLTDRPEVQQRLHEVFEWDWAKSE